MPRGAKQKTLAKQQSVISRNVGCRGCCQHLQQQQQQIDYWSQQPTIANNNNNYCCYPANVNVAAAQRWTMQQIIYQQQQQLQQQQHNRLSQQQQQPSTSSSSNSLPLVPHQNQPVAANHLPVPTAAAHYYANSNVCQLSPPFNCASGYNNNNQQYPVVQYRQQQYPPNYQSLQLAHNDLNQQQLITTTCRQQQQQQQQTNIYSGLVENVSPPPPVPITTYMYQPQQQSYAALGNNGAAVTTSLSQNLDYQNNQQNYYYAGNNKAIANQTSLESFDQNTNQQQQQQQLNVKSGKSSDEIIEEIAKYEKLRSKYVNDPVAYNIFDDLFKKAASKLFTPPPVVATPLPQQQQRQQYFPNMVISSTSGHKYSNNNNGTNIGNGGAMSHLVHHYAVQNQINQQQIVADRCTNVAYLYNANCRADVNCGQMMTNNNNNAAMSTTHHYLDNTVPNDPGSCMSASNFYALSSTPPALISPSFTAATSDYNYCNERLTTPLNLNYQNNNHNQATDVILPQSDRIKIEQPSSVDQSASANSPIVVVDDSDDEVQSSQSSSVPVRLLPTSSSSSDRQQVSNAVAAATSATTTDDYDVIDSLTSVADRLSSHSRISSIIDSVINRLESPKPSIQLPQQQQHAAVAQSLSSTSTAVAGCLATTNSITQQPPPGYIVIGQQPSLTNNSSVGQIATVIAIPSGSIVGYVPAGHISINIPRPRTVGHKRAAVIVSNTANFDKLSSLNCSEVASAITVLSPDSSSVPIPGSPIVVDYCRSPIAGINATNLQSPTTPVAINSLNSVVDATIVEDKQQQQSAIVDNERESFVAENEVSTAVVDDIILTTSVDADIDTEIRDLIIDKIPSTPDNSDNDNGACVALYKLQAFISTLSPATKTVDRSFDDADDDDDEILSYQNVYDSIKTYSKTIINSLISSSGNNNADGFEDDNESFTLSPMVVNLSDDDEDDGGDVDKSNKTTTADAEEMDFTISKSADNRKQLKVSMIC